MAANISKMLQKQPDAVGFGGLGVTPNPVGWVGTVRVASFPSFINEGIMLNVNRPETFELRLSTGDFISCLCD